MSQSRIRVALVVTELNPGGAEKALTALACGLNRHEFDPIVYSLRSRSFHTNHSLIEKLHSHNIPTEFLDINHVSSVFRGIRKLSRLLKDNRTEVLQSFMFHANLIGRLAARKAKVPVVCSGIRVAERGCFWHLLLDRMTQSKVDSYVCVSQSVADFTRKTGKISPDKITVITNGIDLSKNESVVLEQNPFNPDRKRVAFIGRLSRQKGLDWLLDTAPFWLETRPDWDLFFVGQGEDQRALEKKAHALKCSKQIVFLGQRMDVPALLPFFDLVILPSRWEGMPNAIMEAMAACRPVCCTEVEGITELLGHAAFEQVSPIENSSAWITTISRLLDNVLLRQQLGKDNRSQIEQHYVLADKINQYEKLWKRLLSREA